MLFTAFSDTLLLPYTKFLLIATRRVNEQGLETILTYLQKNNVYTATTGRPLTIRGLNGLDVAGAGDTACMVSHRRDPSVLKVHIPMPHRFLPVYQAGPVRWEALGTLCLGGVDIHRPAEVRYTDGIRRGRAMALITNTNRITSIGLPSGAVIPPDAPVDVPERDDIKDRKNPAFYVVTDVLVVGGGVQSDGQSGEEAYYQQLFAESKALGMNVGANSKTETLVSKLAEVKAKTTLPADEAAQKQALIERLAVLGVSAGPDAPLEELQRALADRQVEQQ